MLVDVKCNLQRPIPNQLQQRMLRSRMTPRAGTSPRRRDWLGKSAGALQARSKRFCDPAMVLFPRGSKNATSGSRIKRWLRSSRAESPQRCLGFRSEIRKLPNRSCLGRRFGEAPQGLGGTTLFFPDVLKDQAARPILDQIAELAPRSRLASAFCTTVELVGNFDRGLHRAPLWPYNHKNHIYCHRARKRQ